VILAIRKSLSIAPLLAVAALAQNPMNVIPMSPVGGHVVPAGVVMKVRVDEKLSTNGNDRGDKFTGTLTNPVMVNGQTVIPVGTRFAGHVLVNRSAGIVKGRAQLMISLDSFEIAGRSHPLELTAATLTTEHKSKTPESPDPNAGIAVGNRDETTVPAEAVVTFSLGSPVRI
jgi:hypothetical protein